MSQSFLQIGLRALTFTASMSALVTVLWIAHLQAADVPAQQAKVAKRGPVSLTVYTMQGCGHCTAFKTELAEFSAGHPDVVIEVVEIHPGSNTPKHRNNAQRAQLAGVQGFPTTHVMMKGQKKATLVGMRRADDLSQVVDGLKQGNNSSELPGAVL